MGLRDITPGTKVGRPIAARFIETKKGTVGIEVAFDFQEAATGKERLNAVFWLTEAAIGNSMKTLVNVLKYNGSEQVDVNGVLTDPAVIDFKTEVSLTVELEARMDELGNPKLYNGEPIMDPRIKWVNALGGSAFQGLAPETVKGKLGALGFKAAFLAAKKGGAAPAPRNHAPSAANESSFEPSFDPNDDIPF